MSSWYSRILTNTTSQISSLQSRLLQSENDGDTEDDTHVCRVLRAYYTEKGRPFPGWLPPDPKAPPPAAPVYAQPASQVGSRYGGLQPQQQPGPTTGLSSLWDSNGGAQPRQDTMSLRQGRGAPPPMRGGEQPARLSPFARAGDSGRDDVQARPLPSQRAGSYQSSAAYGREAVSTPPGSSGGGGGGGGGSAQDRLKQRLWGGARTTSPASGGSQGPFQPPARGGSGDYEDRFAPGGMYDGGGAGGGGGGRPTGLPSGPRRTGLPSGPRMR
ncbi:hypothetical protein CGMCC3_g12789 [Colletotrichum fructicola]|nr:uncharacterized protein CGMCC3_g12789 [Colletotrichum fructicola]KAE9571203.1 hypothetical protein CGMCC3_g12789 [Colletotrichum fructicola]KAF4906273.1 hypothetical protein CGCFRS4_v000221 [Colletotrichum fructicola]KAF4931287.1 hypothetical protein CGCVW01_v000510 [Colletotrichum viniferum]